MEMCGGKESVTFSRMIVLSGLNIITVLLNLTELFVLMTIINDCLTSLSPDHTYMSVFVCMIKHRRLKFDLYNHFNCL